MGWDGYTLSVEYGYLEDDRTWLALKMPDGTIGGFPLSTISIERAAAV
jgi:hypothetical protein